MNVDERQKLNEASNSISYLEDVKNKSWLTPSRIIIAMHAISGIGSFVNNARADSLSYLLNRTLRLSRVRRGQTGSWNVQCIWQVSAHSRTLSPSHSSGASISIYTFRGTIGACRCHRLDDTLTSDASPHILYLFFPRVDYLWTLIRVFDGPSCIQWYWLQLNSCNTYKETCI